MAGRAPTRTQLERVMDDWLEKEMQQDACQAAQARALARCQNKEIQRLEGLMGSARSAMSHDKAIRVFAEVQAIVAIEQLKEIHRARVNYVLNGGQR